MHDAVRMEKSLCEREREHATTFGKFCVFPGSKKKKKKKEPEIMVVSCIIIYRFIKCTFVALIKITLYYSLSQVLF